MRACRAPTHTPAQASVLESPVCVCKPSETPQTRRRSSPPYSGPPVAVPGRERKKKTERERKRGRE